MHLDDALVPALAQAGHRGPHRFWIHARAQLQHLRRSGAGAWVGGWQQAGRQAGRARMVSRLQPGRPLRDQCRSTAVPHAPTVRPTFMATSLSPSWPLYTAERLPSPRSASWPRASLANCRQWGEQQAVGRWAVGGSRLRWEANEAEVPSMSGPVGISGSGGPDSAQRSRASQGAQRSSSPAAQRSGPAQPISSAQQGSKCSP